MSDSYKRRPINNNNDNNVFEGIQIPPASAAGYQQLRSSSESPVSASEPIGAPYKRLDTQGRSWYSARCYWITFILLALAIAACGLIVGLTVRHTTLENGDRTKCGDIWIQEGEFCGKYILAGVGTETSATLRRLSTDPTKKILALESGSDFVNDPEVNVLGDLFRFTRIFTEIPNKFHWLINGRTEPTLSMPHLFVSGRSVSGGSQENYMLLNRGTIAGHDEFDASVGSPGTFNGAAMSAVFLELEYLREYGHYSGDDLSQRGDGSAPTQTVKIDVLPHGDPTGKDPFTLTDLFVAALGLPDMRTKSYSQPGNDNGAFPFTEVLVDHDTTSPVLRWSGRKAFLGPTVMDQTTLRGLAPSQFELLVNSTVEKLLFHNGRCVGVQYLGSDGVQRKAYVETDGEVIVGAGIHSAPILQRSGIGPADVLAQAGVTPVLINPHVGQHLLAQTLLQIPFLWPNITALPTDAGTSLPNFAFVHTEDVSPSGVPGRRAFFDGVAMFQGVPGFGAFFMNDEYPVSEGSINISSANPYTEARAVTNAYTTSAEFERMRYHLRYVIGGMIAYDSNVFPLTLDLVTLYDDTLLDAWIAANMGVQYHYFGTCRMGTDASSSVVDNRFRVWGIKGLRVCDLSSAKPWDAHPTLAAFAMGDICGRMILEDAGSLFVASAKSSVGKKYPASLKTHENTAKARQGWKNIQDTIHLRKNQQHTSRHPGRMTDEELWQKFQMAIETIRANYDVNTAQRIITGIYKNPEYKRLDAIYGSSAGKKRAHTKI